MSMGSQSRRCREVAEGRDQLEEAVNEQPRAPGDVGQQQWVPRSRVSCRGEPSTHQASSLGHGDGTALPSAAQESWRAEWKEWTPLKTQLRRRRACWSPAALKQLHPSSCDYGSLAPPAGPTRCVPGVLATRCRDSATPLTVTCKLLCPWNSPGKNTGVVCHSLLQGTFLTQGLNMGLLHCRQILYQLSHWGSPCTWKISGRAQKALPLHQLPDPGKELNQSDCCWGAAAWGGRYKGINSSWERRFPKFAEGRMGPGMWSAFVPLCGGNTTPDGTALVMGNGHNPSSG